MKHQAKVIAFTFAGAILYLIGAVSELYWQHQAKRAR